MKLASTALRQSSTLAARKPLAGGPPALVTQMSAAPNFATTASTNWRTAAASVTSSARSNTSALCCFLMPLRRQGQRPLIAGAHGDSASLGRKCLGRRPANALAGCSHNCNSTLQTQFHKNRIIDGSNRLERKFSGRLSKSSLRSLPREATTPCSAGWRTLPLRGQFQSNRLFHSNRGSRWQIPRSMYGSIDELKDAARSGVPVVNAGLHYGFTVFEGIRCYATDKGPAVFRLEEHVDRLLDSARIVGFRDLPWTRATRDRGHSQDDCRQ